MKTVTVQIGNTDGKLTQDMWAAYCEEMDDAIRAESAMVHFKGGPPVWEKWQNCCWVLLIEECSTQHLREKLRKLRGKYSQDSVAWTEGETQFV